MKRYRIERPKDFMTCRYCGKVLDARNDKEIEKALKHIEDCKQKGKK